MKKINEKQLDRIRGALYGVAVGDALGGPLEFMSDRQICDAYGRVTDMIGGGWLNLKPGEVTDDTQMTLCVARGILDALEGDNGLDLVASVGQQFIAWADSKPKDIGGACSHSIAIAKGLGRIRWQGVPTAADWMEAARQTRRPPCGRQRRSDAHRIPWPLLQDKGRCGDAGQGVCRNDALRGQVHRGLRFVHENGIFINGIGW